METFSDYFPEKIPPLLSHVWLTESVKLDTKVCNKKTEISSFFLQTKYTLTGLLVLGYLVSQPGKADLLAVFKGMHFSAGCPVKLVLTGLWIYF